MKVIHKIKRRKKEGFRLLNDDETWNVVCGNKGSRTCSANLYWRYVTCKKCLKQRVKK